jgi:transposase-like protein
MRSRGVEDSLAERAIDNEGEELDLLVQKRRSKREAL